MREYIDVAPSNGTGSASYKAGIPILNFVIGAQERPLLGSPIRLNGTFTAHTAKNKTGADLATASPNLAMEPRLGVFSVIDSLSISSHQTSQTIEHIKHYPRFLASYIPTTSSKQDLTGHMGVNALTSSSVVAGKKTLVHREKAEFSIPLPCGFLLGATPIPLSGKNGVKGVNIQINLSPDSNIFFADGTPANTGASGEAVDGAYYKLDDLHLTAELMEGSSVTGSYEYNSISSYYSTINQSYATVNFSLGLHSVLALWGNFIQSKHINNYAHNSLATHDIRDEKDGVTRVRAIKELFFTRGSKRFPIEYIISTKDVDTAKGKDPQISRNFLNSIVPYNRLARTLLSPYNTPGTVTADKDLPDGGNVFGVGVALDTISNVGVDYSAEPFGMVINSELTSDTPHSCFMYVRSKQTLIMNAQGVQVVS